MQISSERPVLTAERTQGSPKRPVTFHKLQYLRALAAMSVVLSHASHYVREYRGDSRMLDIFGIGGPLGVVLFFAISGCLMAHLAQQASPMRFMAHRLIRIYPIYWLCVAGVVLARALAGTGSRLDPLALILAPGGTTSYVLGVEWTLPFELTFYILVFLVIAAGLRRHVPLFAAAWILAIEAGLALAPDLQQGQFPLLLHVPLSAYSLPFAAGLLVPFAIRRNWVGPATPLIGFGLLAMSAAMPSGGWSIRLMALGSVLLVASAFQEEDGRPPNRPLVSLGDWSYALYLCHVPVIMALCRALPAGIPTVPLWFAAVGAPVVVASLVGKVDLAVYRWLKTRVDRAREPLRVAVSAVFLLAILGVGIRSYVQLAQVRNASAASSELAARLVDIMRARRATLPQAAAALGLSPEAAFQGHVDGINLQPPRLFIQGWAADASGAGRALRVLLFRCGEYLGAARTDGSRPDVGAALRIGGEGYGFSASFPAPQQCDDPEVGLLLVSAGGAYNVVTARLP